MTNNAEDVELRTHNEYDGLLTSALIKQHPEWDMETVREAALICSNTMKPTIQQEANRQKLELMERLEKHREPETTTAKRWLVPMSAIEAERKQLKEVSDE